MTQQQFFFNRFNRRNGWYGLIIMVIVLVLLFFLVKSIFNILYYLSPLLLVLTLLFDYKVIVKFLSWWWKLFKSNWIYGLGVAILSGIGFPILTGGLFINAFMNWRVKRAKKKQGIVDEDNSKFSDFELLEEELPLSEKEKVKREK